MAAQYSAIVVGGGHNGLVAAELPSRGRATACWCWNGATSLAARVSPKSCSHGFRVSSCSYICHLLQEKVINDLELRKARA